MLRVSLYFEFHLNDQWVRYYLKNNNNKVPKISESPCILKLLHCCAFLAGHLIILKLSAFVSFDDDDDDVTMQEHCRQFDSWYLISK